MTKRDRALLWAKAVGVFALFIVPFTLLRIVQSPWKLWNDISATVHRAIVTAELANVIRDVLRKAAAAEKTGGMVN